MFIDLQSKCQAQESQLSQLASRPREGEDLGDFESTLQSFLANKNQEIDEHKRA